MPGPLHTHYDQLTDREREFVDDLIRTAFSDWKEFEYLQRVGYPLHGGDPTERAVDALSRWLLESRSAAARQVTR